MQALTCARCGVRIQPGRYCPSCSVLLCGACARESKCPADGRDLRKLRGSGVFLLVLGVALYGFALFSVTLELQSYERASFPTTSIANVVSGTTVKISGTIEASGLVAIELRGSGNDHYWAVEPFNLTDGTGSLYVDVTQVQGSTSFWVIGRGLHGDDWWDGDAASIIGHVAVFPNATTYIVAQFIARTPNGFAGSGFPSLLFASVATVAVIGGSIGFVRFRHSLSRHRQGSATYMAKVQDWRACGECGELVSLEAQNCPSCKEIIPRVSRSLSELPTLQLATKFGQRSLRERVAVIVLGVILPTFLGAVFLGIIRVIGLERSLQPSLLLLPIFAIVSAIVFASRFFFPTRIKLSPELIVCRKVLRNVSILTREVDRILTIQKGNRQAHLFITRGDQTVGFGPGMAQADFEASRAWIRILAEATGNRYRENVPLAEALSFLRQREPVRQ